MHSLIIKYINYAKNGIIIKNMNSSPVKNQRKQENLFSKVPKASTELIALTYGALVTKLIKDNQHKPIEEVNVALEKIGYNMGTRMIDEFFSKIN